MTIPQLKPSGHTIQECTRWEGRWELIDGVPCDMSPAPSLEHQRVSVHLTLEIGSALREAKAAGGAGDCEVFHAPVDLYLPGEESVYQPDLVVVWDPAKNTVRGIEGIPEYLIVDPDAGIGSLLRLEEGRYRESARVAWGDRMALLGGDLRVRL